MPHLAHLACIPETILMTFNSGRSFGLNVAIPKSKTFVLCKKKKYFIRLPLGGTNAQVDLHMFDPSSSVLC